MFRKSLTLLTAVLMMAAAELSYASLGQSDLDQAVVRLSQVEGRSFVVEIDSSSDLNAWASADGRVGVTQGMLSALQTQDQLAFVVGHERSHLSKKHHQKQTGQILLGAVLGALAGKAIGNDDEDIKTGAEVGAGILGGKQSRRDEYDADAEGLKLAVKAGYDPYGGIEALQLLQSRYGNGQAGIPVIGWFASHPDTGNRVAALQKLAATLAPVRSEQSNLDLIQSVLLKTDGGWSLPLDPAMSWPGQPAPAGTLRVETPPSLETLWTDSEGGGR